MHNSGSFYSKHWTPTSHPWTLRDTVETVIGSAIILLIVVGAAFGKF